MSAKSLDNALLITALIAVAGTYIVFAEQMHRNRIHSDIWFFNYHSGWEWAIYALPMVCLAGLVIRVHRIKVALLALQLTASLYVLFAAYCVVERKLFNLLP